MTERYVKANEELSMLHKTACYTIFGKEFPSGHGEEGDVKAVNENSINYQVKKKNLYLNQTEDCNSGDRLSEALRTFRS